MCIVGREGKLCAGFDLSVMSGGTEAARQLVARGGELLMRIYRHPQPVVVARHRPRAGGRRPAGAGVRRAHRRRRARQDRAQRDRRSACRCRCSPSSWPRTGSTPRRWCRPRCGAEIYGPAGAVDAGYLDRVVPVDEVEAAAIAEARRLGAYSSRAYAQTKEVLRGPTLDRVQAGAEADLARFTVEPPDLTADRLTPAQRRISTSRTQPLSTATANDTVMPTATA